MRRNVPGEITQIRGFLTELAAAAADAVSCRHAAAVTDAVIGDNAVTVMGAVTTVLDAFYGRIQRGDDNGDKSPPIFRTAVFLNVYLDRGKLRRMLQIRGNFDNRSLKAASKSELQSTQI